MARRLRREEIETIRLLAEKEQNHCESARALGVSEGTVRSVLRYVRVHYPKLDDK